MSHAYPFLPTHPSFLRWEANGIKICFSFSFSLVGWPNSFVHRSEIARPCGNCRAATGPREAGQVPGTVGAAEELAARNRRGLLWTPPSPSERARVIARGPPRKRRNYVKYAHTFLLYNSLITMLCSFCLRPSPQTAGCRGVQGTKCIGVG